MASEDTQFKPGNPGNGGRPKGSRNKLSESFLKTLADDFEKHGIAVIKKIRKKQPAQYAMIIGRLMPKLMELSGPEGGPIETNWTVEVIKPAHDDA